MNKKNCESSTQSKKVSSKMSDPKVPNTIKIRKKSGADILTDQVPGKKQRIKSENENIDGEIVVRRQQKRIVKRRLASTSDVGKNQGTCQTQKENVVIKRKPLTEVSNKPIFQQTANKKLAAPVSKQVLEVSAVSNNKSTSENVFKNTPHLLRIFNSLKLENETQTLELKQMKSSVIKDEKHESKQMNTSVTPDEKYELKQLNGSTIKNECQINKCNPSRMNDGITEEEDFCSSSHIKAYIDDIIENLFSHEASLTEFTDQETHMANFHKIFIIIADHLIRVQDYFGSFCSTVFLATKILEFYTSTAAVDPRNANVVMLASYWIASKYNDTSPHLTSLNLTGISKIKLDELLRFERDILSVLEFSVNFPEPLTFSEYYFFHLDLPDTMAMVHCANYMIHCFLLSTSYFKYKSSKIAAAAVRSTLRYFKSMDEDRIYKCWKKLRRRPAYYQPSELVDVEREIMASVRTVQEPDFKYRQAFKKFSEAKFMSVSKQLLEMTAACRV